MKEPINSKNTRYRATSILQFSIITLGIFECVFAYAQNTISRKKEITQVQGIIQTKGVANGHEWVDLGLPSGTKWATCNVGAMTPYYCGFYFLYGETNPIRDDAENESRCCHKNYSDIKKMGIVDHNGNLEMCYDAASANWGTKWRMPTKQECEELVDKCKWIWSVQGGSNGYKIIGPNGNTIFLIASGYFNLFIIGTIREESSYYMSSTSKDTEYGLKMYTMSGKHDNWTAGGDDIYVTYDGLFDVRDGFLVRPVMNKIIR